MWASEIRNNNQLKLINFYLLLRKNALYKLKMYGIHSRIHHLEEKSCLNVVLATEGHHNKYYRLGGFNNKNSFSRNSYC